MTMHTDKVCVDAFWGEILSVVTMWTESLDEDDGAAAQATAVKRGSP